MTYRTDIPQEGRISGGGTHDLRVSIYPTIFGERAVVRLFARSASETSGEVTTLDALGLLPADLVRLKSMLESPQGLILLTGPAGSGKTTTLYACLRYLVSRWEGRRHIVTIEDPVERQIDGITQ